MKKQISTSESGEKVNFLYRARSRFNKVKFFLYFCTIIQDIVEKDIIILGIESSCDDTSAAVIKNGCLLSNVTASQAVHESYGGVVPELASRAHEQNIVPVVDQAIKKAGITKEQISAVAFTRGPGLNSQIVLVKAYNDMQVIGQTIDDAAGEAIDKCSKVMGLGYPGGPIIDRLARQGNPKAFSFSKPQIAGYDYSFSGLKTSFLYFLRDQLKENPDFIEQNKEDLAASLEATIVDILMKKLRLAAKELGIKEVAVAGGVSANTGLREAFLDHARRYRWNVYIPKFGYTTDNAAMIAITGYHKYQDGDFCSIDKPAYSRVTIG